MNYTNAATILEDFADTEDLDGVFSGLDREQRSTIRGLARTRGDMSAAAGRRDRPVARTG